MWIAKPYDDPIASERFLPSSTVVYFESTFIVGLSGRYLGCVTLFVRAGIADSVIEILS